MQTNAPATSDFVDQFNRATTFRQVQVGGSNLTNPLVLPNDAAVTIPEVTGTMSVINVGSDTIDFPSIGANSTATHDLTVSGVVVGEAVLVTCVTARTGTAQRVVFSGFVGSTNTVTILATNTSGTSIDLPLLSFKIIIFKGI